MERHNFRAGLDCQYHLRPAESVGERTFLVVALHGYGMNAEAMLRLTSLMVGDHIVASLQAPNQFYLAANSPDASIGYNWGTRAHWESSIRLHHEMVSRVVEEVGDRFRIPPQRTILVGFSQPVGLNYRFAATFGGRVRGVIGICGGVPKDWEKRGYGPVSASLLHIARQEDEYYSAEVVMNYPARLGVYADDVEFHLLPGRHRFPSKAAPIVQPWMERLLGG